MSMQKPSAFTAMEMRALDLVLSTSIEIAPPDAADMFRIARERLQQIQAFLLCAPAQLTPAQLTLPELKALMTLSSKQVMSLAGSAHAHVDCDCKAVAHDASIAVQKLCTSMAAELEAAGITVRIGTRAEFEAMINAHAAPGMVQ